MIVTVAKGGTIKGKEEIEGKNANKPRIRSKFTTSRAPTVDPVYHVAPSRSTLLFPSRLPPVFFSSLAYTPLNSCTCSNPFCFHMRFFIIYFMYYRHRFLIHLLTLLANKLETARWNTTPGRSTERHCVAKYLDTLATYAPPPRPFLYRLQQPCADSSYIFTWNMYYLWKIGREIVKKILIIDINLLYI